MIVGQTWFIQLTYQESASIIGGSQLAKPSFTDMSKKAMARLRDTLVATDLVENGGLEVFHPREEQIGEHEGVGLGVEAVPRREAVVELHAEAQHLLDVGANLRLVHLAGRLRSSSRVDRLLLCSPGGRSLCTVQICRKSQRIGCVISHCNLQCGITQPILRLFRHICTVILSGTIIRTF